jgi:hypothetical protein
MLTTHLGSGIWPYTYITAGAVLFVTVPDTISTSPCGAEEEAEAFKVVAGHVEVHHFDAAAG